MPSELVEYIIDDARKHCCGTYDLDQNKEFWFKYGWLTDNDKIELSQFYNMWKAYIEIYS